MARSSTCRIGGDPEFFIATKKGAVIPSCGLIGGTKKEGVELARGYTWLEDNVAVELNFPASDSASMFCDTITKTLDYAFAQLHRMGYTGVIKPAHTFSALELSHPKALTFGCDPDFCAYDNNAPASVDDKTGKAREVAVNEFKTDRFCGGHIHLSYRNPGEVPAWVVVLLLDAYVGLPSLAFDKQGSRRKAYGCAGLYRPKEYGVEYRTMSNWWLNITSNMVYMAGTALSIARAVDEFPVEVSTLFNKIPFADIKAIIDNEKVKEAYELHTYLKNIRHVDTIGIDTSFRFPK
jgi:hypothetical protein